MSEEASLRLPNAHPRRSFIFYDLVEMYLTRFGILKKGADLQKVIDIAETIFKAPVSEQISHNMTRIKDSLAFSLSIRFVRSGDIEGITRAITMAREGLVSASQDPQERSFHFRILAECLGNKSERTGELEHLEESIEMAKEAVSVACEVGSPRSVANTLPLLAASIFRKFYTTQRTEDIDAAIQILQHAYVRWITKTQMEERKS